MERSDIAQDEAEEAELVLRGEGLMLGYLQQQVQAFSNPNERLVLTDTRLYGPIL